MGETKKNNAPATEHDSLMKLDLNVTMYIQYFRKKIKKAEYNFRTIKRIKRQ